MIASAIDGRIRLRSSLLTNEGVLTAAVQALNAKTGVTRVVPNPRTGSLLVEYMPSVLSAQDVVDTAGLPAEEPAAPASASSAWKPMNRAQKMRIAKRGMLASMVLMLLFAAADEERAHIYAGLAFVGFNSYHLYGYRRRLLA